MTIHHPELIEARYEISDKLWQTDSILIHKPCQANQKQNQYLR